MNPALWVVIGGVSAALHVGKLPTALPVLRDTLGVTLVQAGFLLSLVQLAGMVMGLAVGLAADGLGLKRTMVGGLLILSAASFMGGMVDNVQLLMLLRAMEGLGFLLASMPAPSLIRRLVEPSRMSAALGLWGAYMPLGTALALLLGPLAITLVGWQGWWWTLAAVSALMAVWLVRELPADAEGGPVHEFGSVTEPWNRRLRRTLAAPGPWIVALCFAAYSAKWVSVIGFLPSVYEHAGVSAGIAGTATAFAAAVNIVGNIVAGRVLQWGVPPQRLLYSGFVAMALGAMLAFAPVWEGFDPAVSATGRYAAVLLFSTLGGLVPGTLFFLSVRLAPGEGTISTTVGWMQQWSAFGQFAGPPLVAFVATRSGGWEWSWLVTGVCALAGLMLAVCVGWLVRRTSRMQSGLKHAK